jgi:hypothetical protein
MTNLTLNNGSLPLSAIFAKYISPLSAVNFTLTYQRNSNSKRKYQATPIPVSERIFPFAARPQYSRGNHFSVNQSIPKMLLFTEFPQLAVPLKAQTNAVILAVRNDSKQHNDSMTCNHRFTYNERISEGTLTNKC